MTTGIQFSTTLDAYPTAYVEEYAEQLGLTRSKVIKLIVTEWWQYRLQANTAKELSSIDEIEAQLKRVESLHDSLMNKLGKSGLMS